MSHEDGKLTGRDDQTSYRLLRTVIFVLLALTALRFWSAYATPLLWDETYYWMWAQNPAFGYFDHPPLIAWLTAAFTGLFGDGILGLRAVGLANYIVGPFILYAIARVLFDKDIALQAILWAGVIPAIGLSGVLTTPDTPSVFLWTATTLAFVMVIRTERGAWWLAVGALAGLGVLAKYSNLFLGAGLVLAVALDPALRRWLVSGWMWAGGALAVIVMSPTFLWNAANEWATFGFQVGRVGEQNSESTFALTALSQFLMLSPQIWIFAIGGLFIWWRGRQHVFRREIGILLATVAPMVVFVAIMSTYTRVNQQWPLPAYPILALVATVVAWTPGALAARPVLRVLRASVLPLGLGVLVIVAAYFTSASDRWPLGRDIIPHWRGWAAYADDVDRLREQSGATWVATAGYETTSLLAYHLRDRATVTPVTQWRRWLFSPRPSARQLAEPALLLVQQDSDIESWKRCFGDLKQVGRLERRNAQGVVRFANAFVATDPHPDLFDISSEVAIVAGTFVEMREGLSCEIPPAPATSPEN